jgi:Fe-S-cluster-containing hydrogenase component 2
MSQDAPAPAKSYKRPNKVLLLDRETCISCAGCVGTCPEEALDMFSLDLQVFQDKCTYCTICVRFCPVGALAIEKRAPLPGENDVVVPRTATLEHMSVRPLTTAFSVPRDDSMNADLGA